MRSGIFFLVIFCLVACGIPKHPKPSDQKSLGLWDNPDCMIGCWQGLSPGVSTEEGVQSFFYDNLIPTPGLFSGQEDNYNWYTGAVHLNNSDYYVRTRVVDDVLHNLWLSGPFNLTLEEIIERLGAPQLFEVGVFPYGAESSLLEANVYLHYPESGYSFLTYHWGGNIQDISLEVCLQPNYVVYDFHVYEPIQLSEFVPEEKNMYRRIGLMIEREWQGFERFKQDWKVD